MLGGYYFETGHAASSCMIFVWYCVQKVHLKKDHKINKGPLLAL